MGQAGQESEPAGLPAGPACTGTKVCLSAGAGLGEWAESEEGARHACAALCVPSGVPGWWGADLAACGCVWSHAWGALVVLVKRIASRHNVLHLWPFTIYDLRHSRRQEVSMGALAQGSWDHISEHRVAA